MRTSRQVHRFEVKALMSRIVKTTDLKTAGDVRPPRDTAGKPSYTPPATPRADGGMANGSTGGNHIDHGSSVGMNTPPDMLDKPGTGNP
jgi:hypothetical protein